MTILKKLFSLIMCAGLVTAQVQAYNAVGLKDEVATMAKFVNTLHQVNGVAEKRVAFWLDKVIKCDGIYLSDEEMLEIARVLDAQDTFDYKVTQILNKMFDKQKQALKSEKNDKKYWRKKCDNAERALKRYVFAASAVCGLVFYDAALSYMKNLAVQV